MRWELPVLLMAFVAAPAAAAPVEVDGIVFPETADLEGRSLQLVGAGMREVTFLKIDVYAGGIYAEKKSCAVERLAVDDQARLFRMVFVRDVSASRLLKNMREMLADATPADADDDLKARIDRFVGLFDAEARKGMRAEVGYIPGKGTTVTVDGHARGPVFAGEDFARVVFSVWFGPKTCCKSLLDDIRKSCR